MTSTTQPVSSPSAIPQLDLASQYAAIGGEIRCAVERVLSSQQFILGLEGAALESEIAALFESAFGIGVASGTDALILALRACGVGPGDEVLLPPFTFVATGSAVSALGAHPVFADISPATFNLDPAELQRRVTPRTRAIVVVHLYGLAAEMEPVLEFARSRKLPVIEDNAQAIGATYRGRRTGSFGDAGMIVTSSEPLAERLRTLRNHGQTGKYVSGEPGWNSRLDEIQAAILRVKLRHLPAWQRARQALAAEYSAWLAPLAGVTVPAIPPHCQHVFHQYTIRVRHRDALRQFLAERKIGTSVYYPVPLHLQPIYASLGYKPGDFPNAERACEEALSLPMYPELRGEQIARVAGAISEFFARY